MMLMSTFAPGVIREQYMREASAKHVLILVLVTIPWFFLIVFLIGLQL